MKIPIIFLILFFTQLCWAFDHSHSAWNIVLKTYQNKAGLVNYKKLQLDTKNDSSHIFLNYLTSLQNVKKEEHDKWSKNEKMAFLINAYNAFTFKLIIDHYPVTSIKKIGGFFKKPWSLEFFSLLGGKIRSIDPIEHEWLRPNYKDYRIHAAVNCASISCPPLRNEAFVADRLDSQLELQMKNWLNDPSRNQVLKNKKVFEVSKIFDWYKKDFEEWGGGVKAVILKYINTFEKNESIKDYDIKFMPYNWELNEFK